VNKTVSTYAKNPL